MEVIVKIIITACVVVFGVFTMFKAVQWTWTSQIDIKATLHKVLRQKPKIADVVVTRDPNKLYQNETVVADVTGSVDTKNGKVIFEQISNTSNLDMNKPIEYGRLKLKIIRIGTIIGMKSVVSDKGSKVLQSVMETVICEKVE
jgi:hypothetical protein